MTWPEAVEYACPEAWGQGRLDAMMTAARCALEDGLPLFKAVVDRCPPGPDAAMLGIALACLGVGLDLQAQSLAQGASGGRALLLGDGLVTRALELAATLGPAEVEALAQCATHAMANETPSTTLMRSLESQAIETLFAEPSAISDGGFT
ncbi:hypothetical protein JXA88_19350 [Candidatus Fermentibacteria bacterium]|nr:hypothetical protein [Candidatus Fermentibacteria bacterium]